MILHLHSKYTTVIEVNHNIPITNNRKKQKVTLSIIFKAFDGITNKKLSVVSIYFDTRQIRKFALAKKTS